MAEQSGLVVLVPDAERIVGQYRQRHDPSAAAGLSAHVTILFPFADPAAIDPTIEARLAETLADVAPFDARFDTIGLFPGVLFLKPAPADPFEALTARVCNAFPEYPPYGGQFTDTVAHLTVGLFADEAALEQVRRDVNGALALAGPPQVRVGEVALVDNADGLWVVQKSFRLGGR